MLSLADTWPSPVEITADQPPAVERLPGAWLDLHVAPPPVTPVTHSTIRGLHGMVTALLNEGHHPTKPRFSLAPWPDGIGWCVYVHDADSALRVAARTAAGDLYGRPVMIRTSPARMQVAPSVAWRDSVVQVDTMTPVVVRHGSGDLSTKRWHRAPSAGCLLSTLCSWLPRCIGVATPPPDTCRLRIAVADTRPQTVNLGRKLGRVGGFAGRMVLRVNGPTLWLLRCAEVVGLGGRVAFGFGRIRVTEL